MLLKTRIDSLCIYQKIDKNPYPFVRRQNLLPFDENEADVVYSGKTTI